MDQSLPRRIFDALARGRLRSNWNTDLPHMRGGISARAATVAELLRAHGYATYAAGKWQLAPSSATQRK